MQPVPYRHQRPLAAMSASPFHRRVWRPVLLCAVLAGVAGGSSCLAEEAVPRSVEAAPIDNDTCLACHGDPSAHRYVDPRRLAASVHGQLMCTTCHADATEIPHAIPLASVSQQQIPSTCGQCHGDIQRAYLRSVHGQAAAAGKRHAPVCTDCHGEHYVAAVTSEASKVFPSHVPETCSQCHAAERIVSKYRLPAYVVQTYMGSFHGLAHQLGSVTVANCASCHGAHEILPAIDDRSSINPKNLAKTCGACHPGVGGLVARGKIHAAAETPVEPKPVAVVRWFYLALITLVIGGMLVHNLLDVLNKLRAHYTRMAAVGVRARMSLNVRIQHAVLTAAFLALAYTGFALKYPQAWWASPFVGRVDWRSLGHRAAAALFVALALYHAGYVLLTVRGRHHVRALWPRRVDVIQPFQMLAFYLGLRRERPIFARYSYIEKAEYWALVWGSVIMVLTGGLMTWQDWTLRLFPKWVFDVVTAIHFYEAVLACLAILVWHFYFVIFDPDEYPMKWTWVTGQASAADMRHRAAGDEPPEGKKT